MPSHAICAACPSCHVQLCGGDVFMSDFKGLNIFSKSCFLVSLLVLLLLLWWL